MDYRKEAEQILEALGGKENVEAATHCVTRLRLALGDEGIVDQKRLDELDVVKGSFSANNQFQVVIGQGTVDKVYNEFIELAGIGEASKEEVKEQTEGKMNPLQRGVKTLADIFIPILPAIITAGLLLGLNNLLTGPGIFFEEQSIIDVYPQWSGFANMIIVIANTAFVFLPALIGWSAAKKFGGTPLLGILIGLVLVNPELLSAYGYGEAVKEGTVPVWNLFGFEVDKIGYQGQVLPVLVAAWVLTKIELFLRKRIPESIQLLIVAPVALLVTGFLTFIFIGPVTFAIGNGISDGFIALFDMAAWAGGLLYGGLYGALVITGMHHTFLAVDIQLVGSTGSTFLWPMLALSNIAQGSAAFAIFLATKDEKLKGLSGSSGLSAWLGITEPALFGVNLRFKYPFVISLISSGIAGLYIASRGVLATSIGVGGVPGIFSIMNEYWGDFLIGMAIVIVLPLTATYLYAKRKRDV
ncbi:trehalose permease IIC protein [Salimicrobium jeotgali]|uniref:PTS system trehalose-specific transporter subunits IIBC n=2 Tax=Salimicrobium TaxID=351195 RepID=K2G9X7_9BACI|nr:MULTISPECIES: PTS system trehalose-specific EIIBC component [Salimicrobium]AKG03610.1 trehalose permease IIC protein [Salimicrobium jeotgali]EKE31893.1 PTS system trehalose-specific transporter subunits IIBC [Salimicrobium jeotgali]MBM7696076.1 PTS system trehalose-specific IIC component [Salimicrobium jeotgali]SIS80258.1 PTS system trehalose-specific IIB component, Glc family /PTS system trehalose-specific IIC component, Glc family [Salimicrobium salexigens]